MKKDIHPKRQLVWFEDAAGAFSLLTYSTIKTIETKKYTDGKEYPYFQVDISSATHPFYKGEQGFVDLEGRVGRFEKRFGSFSDKVKKKN